MTLAIHSKHSTNISALATVANELQLQVVSLYTTGLKQLDAIKVIFGERIDIPITKGQKSITLRPRIRFDIIGENDFYKSEPKWQGIDKRDNQVTKRNFRN